MPAGTVLDRLGDGIPGVEILAFPIGGGILKDPAAFHSDSQGRFSLEGLSPGGYVLTLNKPGYQILLAQIDTRILAFLRIRLSSPDPSGEIRTPGKAGDMDWVLRMPRSDVLRAIQASPVGEIRESNSPSGSPGRAAEVADRSPSSGSSRIPITGEVRQWYTTAVPAGFGGTSLSDSSGRATALDLSGDLPDHGDWRVRGVTRSLDTQSGGPEPGEAGRNRMADRLGMVLSYRLSEDDSVRVAARYDFDRFHAEGGGAMIPPRQEVRTLGYQANWSRGAAGVHGLEMNMGFVQAEGNVPDGAVTSGGPADDESPLRDRRWNAGARYMFYPRPDHQVSVRAGTRLIQNDQKDEDWILAPVQADFSMPSSGPRGWSVSLSGEDAWTLNEPLRLILGLDYRAWDGRGRLSTIVPRVGARHTGSVASAEGFLLFRMERRDGEEPLPGDPQAGSVPVGYRAEVSRRLDERWTLQGHVLRNPGSLDRESTWDLSLGPTEEDALFLAVPGSTTQEVGMKVTNLVPALEASLESSLGKVSGRVSGAPTESPLLLLGEGDVRYLALSALASVRKSDTHVRLDFRRMEGSESLGQSGGMERASRVDFLLLQEIPFLGRQGPTDWRVLFGYQSLSQQPFAASPEEASSLERVRRFSGGLGVTF